MESDADDNLSDAAYRGDVAGIAAALLAGADPNAFEGTDDWTPLLWAADNGHVAAIAALLAAGARVDGVDSSVGNTPLMLAAWDGRTPAIDALLAAGADVHRANQYGYTALRFASLYGRLDAARVLLDAGARTDVRDKEGKRPVDMVRVPLACTLDAAARWCHAAVPVRRAQVPGHDEAHKAAMTALRAVLAAATPWSRRRPVALACYGVEWEWEV
jgi:uncharacterized protein